MGRRLLYDFVLVDLAIRSAKRLESGREGGLRTVGLVLAAATAVVRGIEFTASSHTEAIVPVVALLATAMMRAVILMTSRPAMIIVTVFSVIRVWQCSKNVRFTRKTTTAIWKIRTTGIRLRLFEGTHAFLG